MNEGYVDANILLRLLTGDDPVKQHACRLLFNDVAAGTVTLYTPDTTIADCLFVLTSSRHYGVPRAQAAAMLTHLVRLPHFKVQNRRIVLRVLSLYSTTARLDFGDAMIAAQMEIQRRTATLYSYDTDFDSFQTINRQEP